MHCNTLKQDNDSTVRGDGGSRDGEVRAGTTSPMPEHKGDKTLGGVRLREKKYHFHLSHYNKDSFVGKPKDLAVHVWYVNHIGFL